VASYHSMRRGYLLHDTPTHSGTHTTGRPGLLQLPP
jgi:hypothetical protein